MKKMKPEVTKRGIPAIWEEGGGRSNTGHATIVAGPGGLKKRPVYIKRAGHLACGRHALFTVKPGDLLIRASHHRLDFEVEIYRIKAIEEEPCGYLAARLTYGGFGGGAEKIIAPPPKKCPSCGGEWWEVVGLDENGERIPMKNGKYYRCKKTIPILQLQQIAEFSRGEWNEPRQNIFEFTAVHAAIEAAKEKATCYHCREPHYYNK